MARVVLGIGTSHTPMLNLGPEEWPLYIELDSKRAHRHKDGRPATYADLLAIAPPSVLTEIAPEKHARRHGEAMAALDRLHEALTRARLDAVIVIGDDQQELYGDDNMPGVLIYRGASIANVPFRTGKAEPARAGRPEWAQRANALYYEERETRHYPVDARLAEHLIEALVEREFDVAVANALPDGEGEGHAFAFVHRRIIRDAAVPVVPIFLNTYYPPNQPSPRRCYRLGVALREAVERYPTDSRIGIVASGGLSHFTVDEAFDAEVIGALRNKDAAALQALPREKLEAGNSEIRNWICAAGALEHLDLGWVQYCPGYRTPAGTGTGMCFAAWS
jgi:3-O-methylgallate 3,4-dioxygenase